MSDPDLQGFSDTDSGMDSTQLVALIIFISILIMTQSIEFVLKELDLCYWHDRAEG